MENIEKTIFLCLIGFFAALTPGPDILLTLKVTLRFGILQGIKVLLGIASGWCIYLGIIYAGFAHYFNTPLMQFLFSLIGGGYLLYLGFLMLTTKVYIHTLQTDSVPKEGYIQGLFINLANPKAILFFTFLITPFINEGMEISLVALWISLFVAFMCVILSANIGRKHINAQTLNAINKICGILFVCFAWLLYFECGELIPNIFSKVILMN